LIGVMADGSFVTTGVSRHASTVNPLLGLASGSAFFVVEDNMTESEVRGFQRTVLFLAHPELWPLWPFLPVVRRGSGGEELGVVYDARRASELTGYSATVFLRNMFTLPDQLSEFLTLPKEVFDTAEELAEAGWRVD
jgi:hypothetical protein